MAKLALVPGLAIYSTGIHPVRGGFHIQVELDGMDHPLGAVNVQACEEYSVRFTQILDEEIKKGSDLIPKGLAEDNYTLEVASAGAERELRLPGDLDRFRGQPLKLKVQVEETIDSRLAVYKGAGPEEMIAFDVYVPKRERRKKLAQKEFHLRQENILRANLYLDF